MSCKQGHCIWRLAETDFYSWREDGAFYRKSIFGNDLYDNEFHFGRVDKFYCSVCRDLVTDKIEAIGDYLQQPDWWSWQGKERGDFVPASYRPGAMEWDCQVHSVQNVLTANWESYG